MQKFSQKWCIASFFEDMPDGFEFAYDDASLHITLAEVFAIHLNGEELSKKIETLLNGNNSFSVTAGKEDHWGEHGQILVVLIRKSIELDTLHQKIYDLLLANGARFNEPQYEGEGYVAHSTAQKSGKLKEGESVDVRSVSIVDMLPKEDPHRRKIIKTIELKKYE